MDRRWRDEEAMNRSFVVSACLAAGAFAALTPATAIAQEMFEDPVCGMSTDDPGAKETHKGVEFVFCGEDCRTVFQGEPDKYFAARSAKFADEVVRALHYYFAVEKALAADKTDGVAEAAKTMGEAARVVGCLEPPIGAEAAAKVKEAAEALHKASGALAEAKDAAAMREAFKQVSRATIRLVDATYKRERFLCPTHGETADKAGKCGQCENALTAVPAGLKGIYRLNCPMVKEDWLQETPDVANPYDPSMPGCGSVVEGPPDQPAKKPGG